MSEQSVIPANPYSEHDGKYGEVEPIVIDALIAAGLDPATTTAPWWNSVSMRPLLTLDLANFAEHYARLSGWTPPEATQ